jgi:hypothetical protein
VGCYRRPACGLRARLDQARALGSWQQAVQAGRRAACTRPDERPASHWTPSRRRTMARKVISSDYPETRAEALAQGTRAARE